MSAPTNPTNNDNLADSLLPLALDKGRGGRGVRVDVPAITQRKHLKNNRYPFPRNAITLIEVVVGLVLLSTLLTVILISTGKLHRQQKAAIQKLEAVRILDELAGDFFREGFPSLDTTGPIESQPKLIWKQTGQPSPIAPDRLVNVRLSILQSPFSESNSQLATLEILVQRDQIGRYRK